MTNPEPAWYCAKTKPKHEHIAASNVRKGSGLEVFHPQLKVERITSRGIARVTEPLFPGYIFIRCVINEDLNGIRYAYGVNTVVHFGDEIPVVDNSTIENLKEYFVGGETMTVEDAIQPGAEVLLTEGAFAGMPASVLKNLSSRQRVQVLFEILGRPTVLEVDRMAVAVEKNSVANLLPLLAAPQRESVRV